MKLTKYRIKLNAETRPHVYLEYIPRGRRDGAAVSVSAPSPENRTVEQTASEHAHDRAPAATHAHSEPFPIAARHAAASGRLVLGFADEHQRRLGQRAWRSQRESLQRWSYWPPTWTGTRLHAAAASACCHLTPPAALGNARAHRRSRRSGPSAAPVPLSPPALASALTDWLRALPPTPAWPPSGVMPVSASLSAIFLSSCSSAALCGSSTSACQRPRPRGEVGARGQAVAG